MFAVVVKNTNKGSSTMVLCEMLTDASYYKIFYAETLAPCTVAIERKY